MNTILAHRMNDVKKALHSLCAELFKAKLKSVNDAIALQKESSAGDTKSSAGDKFETGTAMTHLEFEKLGHQLKSLETSLGRLNAFEHTTPSAAIKAGSLIVTDRGVFWISIGIGEVILAGKKYYVISPVSPIAQQFLGKKSGDNITFKKQQHQILEVH